MLYLDGIPSSVFVKPHMGIGNIKNNNRYTYIFDKIYRSFNE